MTSVHSCATSFFQALHQSLRSLPTTNISRIFVAEYSVPSLLLGLPHRTKATCCRTIAIFHLIAHGISAAIVFFIPHLALIFEVLLCALPALSIINRAALVV